MTPENLLLAASALHLGFQFVVTVVVYPALMDVPEADWTRAHDAHSWRISLLVAPLYLAVATACVITLLNDPGPWGLLACAGQALAAGTTAAVAAPTHATLGREGRTPALRRRLVRADAVRTAGAAIGVAGAVLALA